MKSIVIIGGGTGTFTLLSGLRKYPSNNTVIVSTADDGGSTGVLRKELGVMPPGDIRQCLVGLSYAPDEMKQLFNFRFVKGGLAGHTVGNIILAALEKIVGVENGIELAAKMLNVRGRVLPVSLEPTILSAVLANGKKLVGEHNIDDQRPAGEPSAIKKLQLSAAKANPEVLAVIKRADLIIFGPGDLFTSVLPNILVPGVVAAINKSQAKKVLVTNIMTKFGQTDGFKASDFVKTLQDYLGGSVDVVVLNTKKPDEKILGLYKREKAKFVDPDVKEITGMRVEVRSADLIARQAFAKAAGDKLKRSMLRHDSDKLAALVWKIVS